MADRRRAGRKAAKEEPVSNEISKEDESIAKFLRFNCQTKPATFEGNEVHYFSGKKAVDTLVESKKYGAEAKDPKFARRAQAVDFLASLLGRGMFFRAKVLVPKKKDDPRRDKREQVNESPRIRRVKQAEESNKDGDTAGESGAEQQPKKEAEKKKKKIKIIAHDHQVFNDDTDVYVWIFDPTPLHKKIIGLMIVLGVIAGCLFPLWPDWLRLGVYYLSVTGIALFGLLLGVALARTILFGFIYMVSMGRHNLWILPNLTEDCGFFESFKPFYTYEYCPPNADNSTKKDKKKKKESDEEEPLVEDVDQPETSKKSPKGTSKRAKSKRASPPPTPVVEKKEEVEESDQEEKFSKPSDEENSSAEEDEVSDNEDAVGSTPGSTGDSSEPADVVKVDESTQKESNDEPKEPTGSKPRRRRVRRTDDDDFVIVKKGENSN